MSEAKPCPFCGGTKLEMGDGSTFRWRTFTCTGCCANQGEFRIATLTEETNEESVARCRADAIEEWNKRVPDPVLTSAVACLREIATGVPWRMSQDMARDWLREHGEEA
jgi:hypothetical protein